MRNFITLLFTLLCTNVFAQTEVDSSGLELFNKGLEYYRQGNMDSTLAIWTKMVNDKTCEKYDTYGSAFFNIPTIYWQMKNYEKAKEWYKKVIASNLHDNDETGDLMEPHTNYKHKSALALSGLYYQDSNFTESLKWVELADTVYRYWGFEGSADNVSIVQNNILQNKAGLLLKLNRKDEAIRALLIGLIYGGTTAYGYFGSSENLFKELVGKTGFKKALDGALTNMVITTIDSNTWSAAFNIRGIPYRIAISNTYPDHDIPHFWNCYFIPAHSSPKKKEIIEGIEESAFYQEIKE